MNVSEYIVNYLVKLGVKHVFAVSGGMCMYLIDAVNKHPDIELVQMLHEQSAGIAADAYAQVTGGLGVCIVTAGPGATNAVTSCAASYIDSTPVLYISGQCKSDDLNDGTLRQKGCQEIDVIKMVKGITKFAIQLTPLSNVSFYLEYAIKAAKEGRPGPVWLDITLDEQGAKI